MTDGSISSRLSSYETRQHLQRLVDASNTERRVFAKGAHLSHFLVLIFGFLLFIIVLVVLIVVFLVHRNVFDHLSLAFAFVNGSLVGRAVGGLSRLLGASKTVNIRVYA